MSRRIWLETQLIQVGTTVKSMGLVILEETADSSSRIIAFTYGKGEDLEKYDTDGAEGF